jgi:hypothetical protein
MSPERDDDTRDIFQGFMKGPVSLTASAHCTGDTAVTALEQQLASLIPGAAAAAAGAGGPQHTLSAAMQRRIHHNIQLAARCARLDAQKKALEAEKADLSTRLAKAQVRQLLAHLSCVQQHGPGVISMAQYTRRCASWGIRIMCASQCRLRAGWREHGALKNAKNADLGSCTCVILLVLLP